jgi:2,3-dihydro-2,3-dihydroxybenzoate dehydrogenase
MHTAGVTDSVVLITGAEGGIGSATVKAFTEAGARVFATDTTLTRQHNGVEIPSLAADITVPGSVDRLFAEVMRVYGQLDAVIHTAGVLTTGPVSELTDFDWHRVMAVNATGTMMISRAAARVLADESSLTVVSSNAAATARADMAAYAASKAAVTAFVRSLGLELAPRGIRCNVISPGSTDTPMLRGMWHSGQGVESVIAGNADTFRLGIPLGRVATADDIAGTAVFLASDAARHITLHDLRVDGGATLDS